MTNSMPEREATPDEAYEIGRSFGYDEAVTEIVTWIRRGSNSSAFLNLANSIEITFGPVEVQRP